ncbi:MAG: type II secretion system protein [Planctomycetota bacterium]|nr:type II secretion system protein [Planctomycetota bacterium]
MNARARGFTLIETLVVIGIIALLTGLIMPAVNMVKKESYNTNCLSNLRQNFTVWQSYQTVNKGVLPMCEFLPVVTPQGIEGGLPNLLSKFQPADSRTWLCPADDDIESTETGTSYTYLPGLIRFSPQVQMEVLQVLLNLPSTASERQREALRLQTESKLVVKLFENDSKGLFPILMDSADRHPGTRVPRNGVYLDGSAKATKVEYETSVD